MLALFVELWNAIPDERRIDAYGTGLRLLLLLGGPRCAYFEDASISC